MKAGKWIAAAAAVCVVAVAAVLVVRSEKQKKAEEAFVTEMQQVMDKYKCPGMSCVVVKDNKIIYNHNFGLKDIEAGIPVDDETMFRIASISKSFTATSMMQMIEQGKVTLDTDVSTLAGFPIRNPKWPDTVITLEMLMSHTSSINDSQGYFSIDYINPDVNPDWAKCYSDYEPGTGYRYCNLNFNLTGTFLEKLSGERFDQYVVHHVLEPLGLYGGYCVDSLDASRFAKLYNVSKDGTPHEQPEAYDPRSEEIAAYRFGYDAPLFSPTGGMKITAIDLAKYMIMHMNYGYSPLAKVRIISEESSRAMQTPRSEPEHYGLALVRNGEYIPGVEIVGHTGGAYGLRSAMFFIPERKCGIVVITNGSYNPWGEDGNILTGSLMVAFKHFLAEED